MHMEKKKKKKTPTYLPHELVFQILVRLPVKSLMRFKSVCNSWLTLISDPIFTNSHFELATAKILRTSPLVSIHSIDFESSLYSDYNLNFLPPQNFKIKGSCRGFIILHHSSKICIWNPSTGFHKQIPLSPFESKFQRFYCRFQNLLDFGYDQSKDDYLVVSLIYDIPSRGFSSHLEVFSLRDNMWKEVEGINFPYNIVSASHDPESGSFFNGTIHWSAFRSKVLEGVIVAFDLMERKLFEMELPDDFDHKLLTKGSGLWVFGELFSLWATTNGKVEIWVMKEYKVHSSWTKTLVLPIHDEVPRLYPLCCAKSGDIIGTDGGIGLVKYNDKGQFLEYRPDNNIVHGSQVAMYTESLLPLPGDCVKFFRI